MLFERGERRLQLFARELRPVSDLVQVMATVQEPDNAARAGYSAFELCLASETVNGHIPFKLGGVCTILVPTHLAQPSSLEHRRTSRFDNDARQGRSLVRPFRVRRHGRGRKPFAAAVPRSAVVTPRAARSFPRRRHPRRQHRGALLAHRDGRVARRTAARHGTADDDHALRVFDVQPSRRADRRSRELSVAASARGAKTVVARRTGARAELARVVRFRAGRERHSALQRGAIPVSRRGALDPTRPTRTLPSCRTRTKRAT